MDDRVAPGAASGLPINVLSDIAALLYRAEIAGIPVSADRWSPLGDYAAQAFPKPGRSFAGIHAALAHAMAGDGDGDQLATIAETEKGFAADPVRPVARARGHMARGRWKDALDDLTGVMADAVPLVVAAPGAT